MTPKMAEAIASAPVSKVLLPLNRHQIEIIGVLDEPLPLQVERVVSRLRSIYDQGAKY
ncbi:MAG: DUF3842 family protein [Methylocystaceae bacterium]